MAFGAAQDGQWSYVGTDSTAPRSLSLQVTGSTMAGSMDGISISASGVDGAYFWFHVVRNGADSLYKGQIKAGNIELRESGPQVNRTLTFAKIQ